MKKIVRNAHGFTLIELMIVVAIIGILAAIAIPQFAAYRMRAFNSSAQSDVRNVKTAEEVLQADHQVYGASNFGGTLPGTIAAGAAGTEIPGPQAPATLTVNGAFIESITPAGVNVGVGIGVGNLVFLQVDTEAGGVGSFIAAARHQNGSRAYATDSDTTAIYFVDDPGLAGLNALTITWPAAAVGSDEFAPTGTIAAGGVTGQVVTANWTAQ